jgi:hypothetical protein
MAAAYGPLFRYDRITRRIQRRKTLAPALVISRSQVSLSRSLSTLLPPAVPPLVELAPKTTLPAVTNHTH